LRALIAEGMPAVAVIGGIGVTIRLATAEHGHRATVDVDVVAEDRDPPAIQVLACEHHRLRDQTAVVAGVEIDVIPTQPVSEEALREIEDEGARLFVAAHRWALDTATSVQLTAAASSAAVVHLPVGSPGALVAAKAHAAGYGRAERRANKHGGDLFDIYRLLEVFDAQGALRADLRSAPADTGRLVARVIEVEMLTNPARTLRQMLPSSAQPLDGDHITDVLEPTAIADEEGRGS
jgi:hypothetical protein